MSEITDPYAHGTEEQQRLGWLLGSKISRHSFQYIISIRFTNSFLLLDVA